MYIHPINNHFHEHILSNLSDHLKQHIHTFICPIDNHFHEHILNNINYHFMLQININYFCHIFNIYIYQVYILYHYYKY